MMPAPGQPSMALAVIDQPPSADLYNLSDYDSSDSENENDFLPPGPLDPAKCTLSGPGFIGGSAGSPTSFVLTAKDARSKRVTDGGDYVTVQVRPIRNANAETLQATVKDQGDGSYTVTYSVSARGNYELHIEINGSPIGGNPFPVYFSPPDKNATSPAFASAGAEAAGPSNAPTVTSAAIAAAGAVSAGLSLGTSSRADDDEVLQRTILIANINPLINTEQVKQLFGFCGQVKSCRMVGNNQFAFVEYASQGEAGAAMGLNGQQLGDRALKVENAKSARETTPQGAANPYTAMQLQQMQQLQMQQMQSSSLAAQVAQLRALAKTNPSAATVPAMSANSASQKAAALAAAALLQKKFGSTSGPGNADAIHKRHSPSPDRRGSDRRRDDSRHDRDRHHDSRERRPDSSRDYRSSRSHASADRRREADRIRESRADSRERRDRHEQSDRHRHSSDRHRHSHDRRSREDRHRSRDRHVSSSRHDDSRQSDRDRHRSRGREHSHRDDSSRPKSDRHDSRRRRSSREDQPHPESRSKAPQETADAPEEDQKPQAGEDPQVDGTAIQHDGAEGKDTLVADKLKSPDRSESSRAKSSRHHSSLSPERSPRHKHSKRHKKEHSHKKSKRNRHEDDASVGAPSAAVVDGEAPNEDPVESFEERKEAAAADNDLNALRQAALQTTKAAVSLNDTANGADANVEMAGIDSPGALE